MKNNIAIDLVENKSSFLNYSPEEKQCKNQLIFILIY